MSDSTPSTTASGVAGPATAGESQVTCRSGLGARILEFTRNPWALAGFVALVAATVLWIVIRPLDHFASDPDSVASVLYWQRLINGQRLESFVPTTPKPLLTVVYGVLYSLTGDWRALTVASLAAGAVSIGLAARLATRLGGVAAAVVVVVAMLAWPDFLVEVAHGNSFVWALMFWLIAGVLMTADRPHPWQAGIALALAGIARTETMWLMVAVICCVAFVAWQTMRGRDRTMLVAVAPLLIGLLAVPLTCLHDLLITGRPLYWLSVPSAYTTLVTPNLAPIAPFRTIRGALGHYRPAAPLLILAAVGLVRVVASKRRAIALALLSLGCGVILTLAYLSWRAVFITTRYYEEADAPTLLLAAIGSATVLSWLALRLAGKRPRLNRWVPLATAAVAAALAVGVVAVDVPHDVVQPQLVATSAGYAALTKQIPALKTILTGAKGATVAVTGVSYPVADPRACRIFVPRAFLSLIAVETGAPLDTLGDSFLAFRDRSYATLSPGQYVLHITSVDGVGGSYEPFEHSSQVVLKVAPDRSVRITPVYADDAQGVWLMRIDPE